MLKSKVYPQSAWSRIYDGPDYDEALDIKQTFDGNYIFAGYSWIYGENQYDIWVAKIDAKGFTIWERRYGGQGADLAVSIIPLKDGNSILLGNTQSYGAGSSDAIIIKLNYLGNIIWAKAYGTSGVEYLNKIHPAHDGGYIAAGYIYSYSSYKVWLLKINSEGNIEWQKIYYRSSQDYANDIYPTNDGGYIVACTTYNYGNSWYDIWLLKINSIGDIMWQKVYKGNNDEEPYAIIQTYDGNYIVGGYTLSFTHYYLRDAFVMKLGSMGNVIWQKSYGGDQDEYITDVVEINDGNFIFAGYTISFTNGMKDIWVFKLNEIGDIIWQKAYGGINEDWANSINKTSDGGIILSAYTASFGAIYSGAMILKIDSSGGIDPSCNFIINTSASMIEANLPIEVTIINPVSYNAILTPLFISAKNYSTNNNLLCYSKPGTVPDNDNYPGYPLMVSKISAGYLYLSWGEPGGQCNTQDYAIYKGLLPYFYTHSPIMCTTNGATTATIPMGNESYYFLITAILDQMEGSYGVDSSNNQRPIGINFCFPQSIGNCN